MTRIHHINCGIIQKDPNSIRALCHCILLEDKDGLALIDTGIGIQDVRYPIERIGKEAIEAAGFKFEIVDTAVNQIRNIGFNPDDVKDCVISHLDADHIGGLADFPDAQVHVSKREYLDYLAGIHRFKPQQLDHGPKIKTYGYFNETWYGLNAAKIDLNFESLLYFVSLPGHTHGHCGIAIQQEDKWLLYVGDAYYLKDELFVENHFINGLTTAMAMDNDSRLASLEKLKFLVKTQTDKINMVSYHDPSEFPL
jgi:glyoxylase-like metal-dependent hydrolase (beta-lactamase superfamily II)